MGEVCAQERTVEAVATELHAYLCQSQTKYCKQTIKTSLQLIALALSSQSCPHPAYPSELTPPCLPQ